MDHNQNSGQTTHMIETTSIIAMHYEMRNHLAERQDSASASTNIDIVLA